MTSVISGTTPKSRRERAFSRHEMPELCVVGVPRKMEGAGKTGCWLHPQPRVQCRKHTSVVTTGSTETPGLPCAIVLTLLRALPGVHDLVSHRRLQVISCTLSTSPGAPGPHDFAVRQSRRSSSARISVHRIPPRVRDDAYAPLSRRDGVKVALISEKEKKIIFAIEAGQTE
jgi:hypothetical protein